MYDMTITKREVLVSIVIVCIMILLGVLISGGINDRVMERQQEFNTAIQIDNDKDLFEYGMRTNVGNAFVYGELRAIDTVAFDEIGGEYSYVEKVKEKYTRHTRTVTKAKTVNGKTKTYDALQRACPGANFLHAHEGTMLRNDEIIVYKEDQCTIKYLIELKNN